MNVFRRRAMYLLGATAVASGVLVAGASVAGAAPGATCTGDLSNLPSSAGTLSGNYAGNVRVIGACAVDAGPAVINGNLTVTAGSTLVAAFASGSLTVKGNFQIDNGAAVIIGCNPNSFPCVDDQSATSEETIGGNLTANHPLGLVTHNTTVSGNLLVHGGGGGVTCGSTPGVFGVFGSPAYIDNEDDTVGGNVVMTGIQSCWQGTIRVEVGGSVIDTGNTLADPDASEVVGNTISGNIVCNGNSPAVQYGDSGAAPNTVHGNAIGQCGFDVLQPDPFFDGGGSQPISVKG